MKIVNSEEEAEKWAKTSRQATLGAMATVLIGVAIAFWSWGSGVGLELQAITVILLGVVLFQVSNRSMMMAIELSGAEE